MGYVYVKSEPQLWTVGFYSPDGKWHPDKDFSRPEDAADRVAYLNGNPSHVLINALSSRLDKVERHMRLVEPDLREIS
jgi:hypothetical protein